MPKVAYTEEDRQRIRSTLISLALKRIAEQGVQHTTVEQIYKEAGISRTFFYTFFSTKEELVVEAIYYQQPKILAYACSLMKDPSLSWRAGVERFLYSCCYGEKNGIAILTPQDQKTLFRGMSFEESCIFRQKQSGLFGKLLEIFGIKPDREKINLFTNISLLAMILRSATAESMPLLVPETVDQTVSFQIEAILNELEKMRDQQPYDP